MKKPSETQLRLERETCSRCSGTGTYSYCQRFGTVCFKCGGRRVVLTKRGAAAAVYLKQIRSKPARDLKAGDRIRVEAVTLDCAAGQVWATVQTIEPGERGLEIVTNRGRFGGVAPEALHEVAQTPAQAAETLARALAYQATLTKTGKPRKRAA